MSKNNATQIREAIRLLNHVDSDLEEKLDMIEAGETHGAEWADQEDAFIEAREKIEECLAALDHVEGLV